MVPATISSCLKMPLHSLALASFGLPNWVTSRFPRTGSILPGSRIRVQNISNHTDDELRIMKIIHKKDGAKPATTEIEYYDVYDLAHPNIFPGSNIIERITTQSEKNAEMGPRIETYQNIKNPRKVGIGSQSFITPVEVTNVSSDLKVAEVRILNTSGLIKNVITW